MASSAPRTLVDKLWDPHVVTALDSGRDLVYIDLHLIHEVTTPQAFEGLRLAGDPASQDDLAKRLIATPAAGLLDGPAGRFDSPALQLPAHNEKPAQGPVFSSWETRPLRARPTLTSGAG